MPEKKKSIAKTAGKGIAAYLTDWKNLLAHALFGVVLLVIAIFAPIPIYARLLLIAALICCNILRMRWSKKRKEKLSDSSH
ncbi:MAG: hypothetical protein Q4Q53_02715 [Methanocorpusculum sp.]|nr:hypothetical protein [Methanocorpusculum sp.]